MADREFIERLPEEIAGWRRDGLIDAGQARAILARYGITWRESDESRRQGRLAGVVTGLGAVLTGVGVILFVASNWESLGRVARLVVLLLALVAAYGLGYWSNRRDHPRIGGALIFLGTLIFGANIFLVAQTYHVNAGSPLLLIFWAVGAYAVAYTAGSRLSMYLAVFLTLLWYPFQLEEWRAFSQGSEARALGTATILPMGLLLFALGSLHRSAYRLRPMAGAFVNLGIITVYGMLLAFSFADLWRSLGEDSSTPAQSGFWPVTFMFVACSAGTLLLTGLAAVRRQNRRGAIFQGTGLVLLWLSSLLIVFHPFDQPEPYAAVFNLLCLAAALWGVVLGIWSRQEALINLSLLFFAFLVFSRYFDFFFSLFDRSLVFIGAGVLLLAGGWLLERSRRHLIARMNAEVEASSAAD